MKPGSIFFSVILGTLLIGCAGGTTVANREAPSLTMSDMSNVLNGEASEPYSQYMYKTTGKDETQVSSGIIMMSPVVGQDIRLEKVGSKLKVVADQAFVHSHDLQTGALEEIPFDGGYTAGGKLEIMPRIFRPVEVQPKWFPGSVAISVDRKCNFQAKLKNTQRTEISKLVTFIDARAKLDRTHCRLLGTFQNIPELSRLIGDLRKQGKYDEKQSYVLRLNWSDTFALVRLVNEGR